MKFNSFLSAGLKNIIIYLLEGITPAEKHRMQINERDEEDDEK